MCFAALCAAAFAVSAAEPTTQPTVSGSSVTEQLEVFELGFACQPVPVSCQDC
jgi:hypothetical protein